MADQQENNNWVDQTARHQIINAIVFKEKTSNNINWIKSAKAKLEKFGIFLSSSRILQIDRELRNGVRNPIAASAFRGKIVSRYGKDLMYMIMKTLSEEYINNQKMYVGLPADQIVDTIHKYDTVVACERHSDMFLYMKELNRIYNFKNNATLVNNDILKFLKTTDRKFNIYDFDFMCYVNNKLISEVASAVNNTCMDTFIINIATCIGRKITEDQYRQLMPSCIDSELSKCNIEVITCRSGSSRDTVTPMRYEILVCKRK